jgi:hypothetical protein
VKLRLILIATILLLTTGSAAQNCAYTFSWNSARPTFAFCVTNYGTIGMIQSPIGNNLLDATNPVEGFEWFINYEDCCSDGGTQVPGIGRTDWGVPTFTEPNGAGKLPLYANFGAFVEKLTADPASRTITTTFRITDCGFDCYWDGVFLRAANPRLDGQTSANFGNSSHAAFAYVDFVQNYTETGHGLMLSVPDYYGNNGYLNGCANVDPNGVEADMPQYYDWDWNCDPHPSPYSGTGGLYTIGHFSTWMVGSRHHGTVVFKYQVF